MTDGAGLCLQRHRCQRRQRVVAHPRLQRPAAVAPCDRGQPHRERAAAGPRGLHPAVPYEGRRHHPGAPPGAV
ncbi:hypothetical protein APY03_5182 [Variovorax sp. WDL1]|nr:hypothetical protein APY03_5182 [Variovorax sp. WDL1]